MERQVDYLMQMQYLNQLRLATEINEAIATVDTVFERRMRRYEAYSQDSTGDSVGSSFSFGVDHTKEKHGN